MDPGLTDELTTLEDYLQQLNAVQSKISSAVPTATLIENHNQIVEKSHAARSRVETLFKQMKEEYQQLLKEIDAI